MATKINEISGMYTNFRLILTIRHLSFLYQAGVAAIFGPGTPVAKAACQILDILLEE